MKAFADTNWLVAAYFRELDSRRTTIADRFAEKHNTPWLISEVVSLECENTFRLLGGSGLPPELSSLQEDLGTRIKVTGDSWTAINAKAKELFQRFSHKTRLGTLDVLILASALRAEATHFLFFDTNSNLRALAAVLKLKVFPDLTAEDKRRVAVFR